MPTAIAPFFNDKPDDDGTDDFVMGDWLSIDVMDRLNDDDYVADDDEVDEVRE